MKSLFAVAVAYSNLRENDARLEVPDDIFTMHHQGSVAKTVGRHSRTCSLEIL